MEITCHRCHGTIEAENLYCATCGLPQLVYSVDEAAGQGQTERWNEPVRDASIVAWRPALRSALMLAVPAGILCSALSPVSIFGVFWMAAASAWVVLLYARRQQTPWITLGAGARIGLVTGIFGGWAAAGATGVTLIVMRFVLHQGKEMDSFWQSAVMDQFTRQWQASGADAHTIAMLQGWLLSPEGRAGFALGMILFLFAALVFFAVAGGALGARLTARARRPGI
jgi:hypothetical protein